MFNVPYGARKSGRLPGVELLENCSALLSKAELVAGDFEEVLALVGPEDFVYLDPPFSISNRRVFREYGPAAFSTSDLTRLRHWLLRLDKMGSAFLVSYADSREARNLGKDFAIRSVIVQRHIAGFARHRRVTRELLISNRPPSL